MRRALFASLALLLGACAEGVPSEQAIAPIGSRDRVELDASPYDRGLPPPLDAGEPADSGVVPKHPDDAALDAAPPPADATLDPDAAAPADAGPPLADEGPGPEEPEPPELRPDPGYTAGWIGGPCVDVADCAYDGAVCLRDDEGYPRGHCTLDCARTCPDLAGMPTTFCVDGLLAGGACTQRCDFDLFGASGCRPGYVCELRPRYNEPALERGVCLPGADVYRPLDACFAGLDDAALDYERREPRVDHPEDHPELSCVVDGPLYLSSPIGGVTYRYLTHDVAQPVFVSCELAAALVQLSALLREYDVVEVGHIGTYNCRVIAGTDRLSQHSHGYAIDLQWFRTADGAVYNVVDDWEHDNVDWARGEAGPFRTEAGRILYEIGWQMYARRIFNTVLTPDYNADHDNHFHVDLHPDQVYIGLGAGPGYFGPNLTGD